MERRLVGRGSELDLVLLWLESLIVGLSGLRCGYESESGGSVMMEVVEVKLRSRIIFHCTWSMNTSNV